ncbi:solute carrier family 35 member C2-like isoform X2 [Oppia nitens]|uniref:solute carrier family 35 member C2-like isoform X2 n=1 Tax=Oppia nitens TaxID=1686743 RepID=UPI0023DA7A58|nr:solute carrier family 35 member C2-like isoform X2 [Oppia nitens]XP_054165385.1 solute carrier family 35 member C2-like isoform X2 [Oppia nitens]
MKSKTRNCCHQWFWRYCCFDKLFVIALRTLGLISIYYLFSIGITFYQKWFIKRFHYPLSVVMCHMIIKLLIAALIRQIYKWVTGVSRITLNWSENGRKLSATGMASALDIGFSNWSFEFITISLYTMTKSTCIIFILLFAIIFDLEKKRFSLIIVVFLISIGLFMFTYHSTQFQIQGFLLVLSASLLGGLRWTLSQLVMQRKEVGLSNPLDMMYHIQPWMLLGLIPLAVVFEGIPLSQSKVTISQIFNDSELIWEAISLIIIGSILAFFMEFSEFLLLTYTSSLTLSIAGIFKEYKNL